MISTIVKLLNLPACSIDEQVDAVAAMREGHYLVRGDHVKDVVVQLRNEYDALRKQHAADLLRVAEAVREACAKAVVAIGPAGRGDSYDNAIDDAVDAVRATPLTATPYCARCGKEKKP